MENKQKQNHLIDVDYVASLARIELNEDEKNTLQKDMERVLDYVNLLAEKNVSGIEATAHAVPVINVFRKDECGTPFPRNTMLRKSPESIDDTMIKVPQVIPGEEEQ